MFKTIIGIMEGQTDNTRKICETIKSRDPTFRYSITEPGIPSLKRKFESLLIIHSSTEKEANKRGGWFIHKCKNAKVAGYFWVKYGTCMIIVFVFLGSIKYVAVLCLPKIKWRILNGWRS